MFFICVWPDTCSEKKQNKKTSKWAQLFTAGKTYRDTCLCGAIFRRDVRLFSQTRAHTPSGFVSNNSSLDGFSSKAIKQRMRREPKTNIMHVGMDVDKQENARICVFDSAPPHPPQKKIHTSCLTS